nr:phage major capsid protein [Sedimentibacter sp.]
MKKIYELKNQRAALLTEAETALNDKNMDIYNSKMAEVKNINTQISAAQNLEAEKAMFDDLKNDNLNATVLTTDRNDKEYMNAFLHAITNGYTFKTGKNIAELKPLYNALTEIGVPPGGQDGGFLVPTEFNNMINEQRRQLVSLATYFNVELVKTSNGWRATDVAPTTGFGVVGENTAINAAGDQPLFAQVTYALVKYGLIVPVSRELMEDNTVGLMAYLARWFAKKGVITENTLLLGLLNTLVPVQLGDGTEIADLKAALTRNLDPSIALNAVVITNQSGFAMLDGFEDTTGRGLLQPDPTSGTPMLFKNKPVVEISDVFLPNRNDGTNDLAPIYIGNYKQFGTLFRRDPLEVASTDIGGNAWRNDAPEVRGLIRLDAQIMDSAAAIKREVIVV